MFQSSVICRWYCDVHLLNQHDVWSAAVVPVSHRLHDSCLHLYTILFYFSPHHPAYDPKPSVYVNWERLDVFDLYKHLGVLFDSNLTFRQHITKTTNIQKFNLANLHHIGPFLNLKAAQMYMHAKIFFLCLIVSQLDHIQQQKP